MTPEDTALILIGFQNDYFAQNGILRSAIEETSQQTNVLPNTLGLVEKVAQTEVPIISTPIIFTPDYSELIDPVGILAAIADAGAFKADTHGSETIPELQAFGDRITEVPGRRGLNAFSNTDLDTLLAARGVTNVVLAGVVTSICIDSTGRSAFDRGYRVQILSDCTCGRTQYEQDFYCSEVFPLYAEVISSEDLLANILTPVG